MKAEVQVHSQVDNLEHDLPGAWAIGVVSMELAFKYPRTGTFVGNDNIFARSSPP